MSILSKIMPFLLALTIGFNAIGQVQTASEAERILSATQEKNVPAYWDISAPALWAVINMDKEVSSLLRINSLFNSEKDQKNHPKTYLALESALERYASIFLNLSKDITGSPSISELLYPFYFYF